MRIELNIGLNIASSVNTSWQRDSRADFALKYLTKLGDFEARRAQSATEDTLVVVMIPEGDATGGFSKAAFRNAIERLAYELDQDCIAVFNVDDNAGELVGSDPARVANWGEFNPEFFIRYASEVAA
jgi:hypothetical protein